MTEDQARALFLLAGFETNSFHKLPNGYDDDRSDPWWLVYIPPQGMIKIGWRKRVIMIDWTDMVPVCGPLGPVTSDDVTQQPTYVHAWSTVKALEYMTELRKLIDKVKP